MYDDRTRDHLNIVACTLSQDYYVSSDRFIWIWLVQTKRNFVTIMRNKKIKCPRLVSVDSEKGIEMRQTQ